MLASLPRVFKQRFNRLPHDPHRHGEPGRRIVTRRDEDARVGDEFGERERAECAVVHRV